MFCQDLLIAICVLSGFVGSCLCIVVVCWQLSVFCLGLLVAVCVLSGFVGSCLCSVRVCW